MITINQDKTNEVLAAYKQYFPTKIGEEIYKWKALKKFQDTWDSEAEDFVTMFREATSLHDNLLTSRNHFPIGMVAKMYGNEPDTVREMFRVLFDETGSLEDRISHFINESNRIQAENWPKKMHYQDVNVISVYLWSRYPDKYYIYKYSEVKALASALGANYVAPWGAGAADYVQSLEFFDLVRDAIQRDPQIRPMLNAVLTSDCYKDANLNCVVGDLSYYVNHYYKGQEARANDSSSKTTSDDCNYWWLCASPTIWSLSDWRVGEEQAYTLFNENGHKRRIFRNFIDAEVGDKVICYEATPTQQITALASISQKSDGNQIHFKKEETLTNPIPISVVKGIGDLGSMEFFLNSQGSFFKLTGDEYDTLMDIIRESNKRINQKPVYEKYTQNDFLSEVFMTKDNLTDLRNLLTRKKNIILQGAPGVGKTFCARRLAFEMMGEKDDSRVCLIQFHQNYSYEDFIMGYKPSGSDFELQRGVFYKFCIAAANNPGKDYFFIIDEINRGNLSKIFGELLMLIEKDYRGEKLTLAYKDEKFAVPQNLYIIGMMNTADRSLAIIDYALRRRFSFFDMKPGFKTDGFKKYQKLLNNKHFDNLIEVVEELNKAIAKDDSLGEGFELGHSYFCGQSEVTDDWLCQVIKYDIVPMLQEYWFDNHKAVEDWKERLEKALND